MPEDDHKPEPEERPERAGSRTRLPIPMQARIGSAPSRPSRLRDISVSGFRIDWHEDVEVGEAVIARFEGYPGVCPAFILHGRVARVITGTSPGVGVAIDRAGCPQGTLEQLRKLVLHYMRHRPLLDELARDFFEGRCESCEWIGRVGSRSPLCPRCGQRVRSLDPDQ